MQQILTEGAKSLGLSLPAEALPRFQQYYALLTAKNAVMNLTAIKGEEDSARLHFLDSLALQSLVDFSGASVIDIGTGAGFPGLPLKIAVPDLSLTLLDSHQKRVSFLEEVCAALSLQDVRCLAARAEDVAGDIGGSFDFALSRAVARLNILCELCLPFVHVGGCFIAMKGPACEEEVREAQKAITILGGATPRILPYTIPGTDIIHSAVIIEKIKATPPSYPRQFGRIKKAPL
jgi:16S rRNA (guanine527-N7)-methyltransferase